MFKFRFILLPALLSLAVASMASARPRPAQATPPVAKPNCTHALCKIAGSVLWTAENVIDVAHVSLDAADVALKFAGPVKVLVPVEKVVSVADSGVAYVDTATEHAELYLFGINN